MAPSYRFVFRRTDAERDDANRQTSGLAALCLVLALVVVGLVLIKHLHAVSAAEDCLLMGRPNCDAVIASVH